MQCRNQEEERVFRGKQANMCCSVPRNIVAQLVKNLPAMRETWVLVPGLGRSPGEEKGYLLQYSGLENSMDCGSQRVGHD